MKILEKMEKLANTVKLLEGIIDTTQVSQSPRLQRLFKGIQSMEQVHSAMTQAQQIQELFQIGKDRNPLGKSTLDNVMPLLLFLFNNLNTTEEATPDPDKAMPRMDV